MFDYTKTPKEYVHCNLCGKDDFFILAERSSNGYEARACLCKNCGLIYLNPRMTKEGYAAYYKDFYRKDRAEAKKDNKKYKHNSMEEGFLGSVRFGEVFSSRLKEHINPDGITIDVGSNSGGALQGFKNIFPGIIPIGIEPSDKHAEFANTQGIKTFRCLFEDFPRDEIGEASNIFCFHTLNHLLDPKGFFHWAYATLQMGGRLVLSVKNFRAQVKRSGTIKRAIQIDHPYMFTPENLRLMLVATGFQIVYEDNDELKLRNEWTRQHADGLSIHHIRVVAEKKEKKEQEIPISAPSAARVLKHQLSWWHVLPYYFVYHSGKMKYFRKIFRIGY